MLAAVVLYGLGYAESWQLTRTRGGWQLICWALVLSLPVSVPLAWAWAPPSWSEVGWQGLASLGYVTVFSMLVGFVFWYRGLALGGCRGCGAAAAGADLPRVPMGGLLLSEPTDPSLTVTCAAVLGCVVASKRFRGVVARVLR